MSVLFLLGPLHHDVHEELDLVLKVDLHVPSLVEVQVSTASLQVLLRLYTVWSLVHYCRAVKAPEDPVIHTW